MPRFLRHASWREVVALFPGEMNAIRNAEGWARRYEMPPVLERVDLQAWSHDELQKLMSDLSQIEPRMTVDVVDDINNAALPPRVDGLPAVLVKFGDRYGMIDGKHRVNRWKHIPGEYAVLVVNA